MKFRLFLIVICLIPLMLSCAAKQPDSCTANLEPMYGATVSSEFCKAEQEEFLAAVEAKGLDKVGSSTETAKLGFNYLNNGDMLTAMKRFNQAWLLDKTNCMTFNGFGIIKYVRDHDVDEAIRMFDMGLERCPDNGMLMSDYGRVLEESGLHVAAVSMYEKSLQFVPDNLEAFKGLVRTHIQLGNDEACLRAIRRGEPHGLNIDRELIQELERRIEQRR